MDSSNRVPDKDTIGRFRALPVEHGLQEKLFAQVHDVTMVPKLLTGDETEVYGVAGIWEHKSARIPSPITSKARRSNTKSTADRPKANIIRLVPWDRFGEENMKNPLSGRK